MKIIKVNSKDGEKDVAIYDEKEKDVVEDLCKTEDYGKLVDLVNEQEENK